MPYINADHYSLTFGENMRFNKDIEYALIGLTAMEETTDLLSARDIADEFQIPYDLLSKILQKLVTSGVIASVKGARGGYRLENGVPKR